MRTCTPRMRQLPLVALGSLLVLAGCANAGAIEPATVPAQPGTWSTPARDTGGAEAATQKAAPNPRPDAFETARDTRRRNDMTLNWPRNGTVAGIGTPIVVDFEYPVARTDRVELAEATTVLADGQAVAGGWYWPRADQARFRPYDYWPGGASIHLDIESRDLSLGQYRGGRKGVSVDFTTGRAMHAEVDGRTQVMTVYKGDKAVREIPVSLGKDGWETRNGTKLVISHDYDYTMRGTDESGSYEITVDYAMRVTYTGEFIHSAPWATGRLGRYAGSHGCTNVSTDNGAWLMDNLPFGAPVRYHHTGGTGTDPGNGVGDWNVPDKDLIAVTP